MYTGNHRSIGSIQQASLLHMLCKDWLCLLQCQLLIISRALRFICSHEVFKSAKIEDFFVWAWNPTVLCFLVGKSVRNICRSGGTDSGRLGLPAVSVLPELRAEPFSWAPRGGAIARCWQRSAGTRRRFGRAAAGERFPPVTGAVSALFKILGWGRRASLVRKCSSLSYSPRYSFTVTPLLYTCKMWLCLELSYSSAAVAGQWFVFWRMKRC